VRRYNEHGVAGLSLRQSPGHPPVLTEEQMEELRQMVLVRWRCVGMPGTPSWATEIVSI
jgi:transposase